MSLDSQQNIKKYIESVTPALKEMFKIILLHRKVPNLNGAYSLKCLQQIKIPQNLKTNYRAVNGRCDRNVISACYTSVLGSAESMQAQCAAYENIKTCIAPHKDACAGDPTLATITSLEQMCGSGGFGGDGDGGDPPNIQNECAISKWMTCIQMIQNLVTENFEGFPSAQIINTVCPNFKSFKNCISPIERACGAIRTVQAQQIIKGIQAAVSLTDLMCGSEFKAGFLKHGMQCFDKKSFKNATRNKCASMMAPRPETSSLSPSPESKARECR
ncbi:Hypothetical predicted protein, partial [Mytilus galloprovincialis]